MYYMTMHEKVSINLWQFAMNIVLKLLLPCVKRQVKMMNGHTMFLMTYNNPGWD